MRNLNHNENKASDSNKNVPNTRRTSSDAIKRPSSLQIDLNKKFVHLGAGQTVLSTPDLNMCKLGSPELESFILNTDTLQTPTPSLQPPPIFPTKITSEQEDYAKGFEDALKNLHSCDTTQVASKAPTNNITTSVVSSGSNPTMSGGQFSSFEEDDQNLLLQIKEEPQQQLPSSNSPQMSPINMENQERIKLERKRQRNRVAASKCRKRKLERISKLEDRVKILKVENSELGGIVLNLKQHVFDLKQQVINHHNSGCQITISTHHLQ
ncbi:unnamed protein product [Diamesa hyperborea]